MNTAYSPWLVSPNAAPESAAEILSYLIDFAVLAPSSHNTQPWQFRVNGDALEVYADQARRLPVADPTDRQLYISLGAALENIERAAAAIGKSAVVRYVLDGDLAARVTVQTGAYGVADARTAMIARRSTRLPFALDPLAGPLVDGITAAGRGGTAVHLLQERPEVEAVARINADASGRALSDPVFRMELVKWVRNNWTKQPDGMPGFVQNIPGPVSLLAPVIMRKVNIGPDQAKKDYALFAA
ncbi:MAG TPA: hypothetical protein VHQ86_03190, partial [Candidatus Saccharimonadia bacterium]|nr:hypothetical protein [Candidatus Saccharimonadia bacterium]